jgi:capsular exopolysaccharide synthesis family protein
VEHEPEGQPNGNSLTLADGLRLLRRYWIGVVAFVAAATAIAFGWYLLQPKVYAAESSGIVVAGGGDNLGLSLAGDNLAKAKVKSYQSVAESRLVADRVAKDLGLSASGAALAGGVSVSVPADTAEIHVTAHSTDPALAQSVADDWVVALAAQVREIEMTGASSSTAEPAVRIVPLAKASLPGAPVSPNLKLALGIGAAAGLLLGLGYALLRGFLDRRIRTASDAERSSGHPVIGTLPADPRLANGSRILEPPSSGVQGSHAMGEALRELRTNLQFIDVDNPPRIILVTSSVPSEGKSTVLGNLAAAMASAGENVVVVDADLRRPTVHDVFDVVPGVGLTDVLAGRASVEDVLQNFAGAPNLRVLGAGRIPPNPSELLGSRMMKNLLTHLAEDATVLVDAPPLLPVTDAAVLSRSADGTILVARVGKTTTDSLERAVGNLDRVRGKVLGVILNGVSTKGPESYTYGYYGTYTEHQRGHEKSAAGRKRGRGKGAKARPASAQTAVGAESQAEGAQIDPLYSAPEPVRTEEVHAEPVHAEPEHTEPVHAEPERTEPVHAAEAAPVHRAEPVHAVPEPAYSTPEVGYSESDEAVGEPTALTAREAEAGLEEALPAAPHELYHVPEERPVLAFPAPQLVTSDLSTPSTDDDEPQLRDDAAAPATASLHAVRHEAEEAVEAEGQREEIWLPVQLRGRRSAG